MPARSLTASARAAAAAIVLLATATAAQAAPLLERAAGFERGGEAVTSVRVDRDALRRFRAEGRGRIALPLPDGGEVEVVLTPFELFRDDATIIATGARGARPIAMDLSLFRGVVPGDPHAWALVSMSDETVLGTVEARGRRWAIAPARGGDHVVHDAELGAGERAFDCGAPALDPDPLGLATAAARRAAPERVQANSVRYEADIAIDCDFEYYANKFGGNLTNATQYITTVMATVSLIYQKDLNVQLRVPYLNIWTTSADPYAATNTSDALDELQTFWNANRSGVSRDLAHLVSGKGLGGGIAYIGVLCNGSFGYGVSAVDAIYSYPTNTSTWDVVVLAHELGHNFNSRHTQSCFWQGAGYAPAGTILDSCVTAEGSCYSGPTGIVPTKKGTIMSYCHLVNGVANSIRLDFHPASIIVMRQHAETGCLQIPQPQPPTGLTALADPSGAQLSWTASTASGVIRYDVYRSTIQLDLAPALIGNTTGTTFLDASLGSYYYKVKAVRASDSSPFSNEVRATLCAPGTPVSHATGNQSIAIARADFDEDGIEDLAVANFLDNTVSILRGTGSAGVGDGGFAAAVNVATVSLPTGMVAGDFDENGITDLAVCSNGSTVGVLFGNGAGGIWNGTFTAGPTYATAGSPWGLIGGDFDENGITDLAVACAAGRVSILLGNGAGGIGNGTFAPAVNVVVASGVRAVVAGDWNHDGITDLATANGGAGSVSVLYGNGTGGRGDGAFTLGPSYAVQSLPHGIATGDFNEDGVADLAVANASSATISVLRGNGAGGIGDGTFAAATHHPTGANPYSVGVLDWDGDGVADIASNSFTTANLFWVIPGTGTGGIGNGSFGGAQSFAGGPSPRALLAGDFDENGQADVAIANAAAAGKATVVRGTCVSALSSFIEVTRPDSTETWWTGTEQLVTWSKGAGVLAVNVELTRDGGASWETLARDLTGTSFAWTVTEPQTSQARVRVRDATSRHRFDVGDSAFTVLPSSLLAVEDGAPLALAVRRITPNPARGAVRVAFALPSPGRATLELLDLAGRAVRTLELGPLPAGVHHAALTAEPELAPGLYLVRLAQHGRAATGKVALLR